MQPLGAAKVEKRFVDRQRLDQFGMVRGLGALIGAVLYAQLAKILSVRVISIRALLGIGCGALVPVLDSSPYFSGLIWGVAWGFQETAFVTIAMRYASGPWAATFFAISMIFSNLGTSIGEAMATSLVPKLGYNGVFVTMAILSWSAIALLLGAIRPVAATEP